MKHIDSKQAGKVNKALQLPYPRLMTLGGVCLITGLLFSACKKDLVLKGDLQPMAATSTRAVVNGQPEIRVLSFNVKHNDAADPQSITERQGYIRQIIVDNNPDIFGLQEFSDNSFETWFIP